MPGTLFDAVRRKMSQMRVDFNPLFWFLPTPLSGSLLQLNVAGFPEQSAAKVES